MDLKMLVRAVRTGELTLLRATLREKPGFVKQARLIVDAARFAQPACLQHLLERGADPDAMHRGYRPLHALIQERPHGEVGVVSEPQLHCLELLLRSGADPQQQAAYPPASALLIAAFTGLPPFVEALLGAGQRPDGFVEAALGRSAAVGRRLARDPGFATARDRGVLTALQCAAASRMGHGDPRTRRGLQDSARRLLDAGADPNTKTRAWSHEVDVAYFASGSHQMELFRLLLERGADPTEALSSAAWNAPLVFSELALAHGAQIDRARSHSKPLLNDLIRWGQVRQVLWLLERGADTNLADENGWTALHQAASRGNARMLTAVLESGGDRRRADRQGRTPLDVARELGRTRSVTLLSS